MLTSSCPFTQFVLTLRQVRRSEMPTDFAVERQEEREGQDQLRGKIEGLGKFHPANLNSKEPFDWASESGKDATFEKARPESINEVRITRSGIRSADISQPEANAQTKIQQQKTASSADKSTSGAPPQAQAATNLPDRTKAQSSEDSKEQKAENMKDDGSRAHVLLVEDNHINQKIVSRKLVAKGFVVTTANNGQEAVDKIQEAPKRSSGDGNAFDVVLMDQEMPVLDGNSATRKIRELEKDGKLEHVPILGVTANVRGAQQDEMLAAGMDDVISKPYKIEDMVSQLLALAN